MAGLHILRYGAFTNVPEVEVTKRKIHRLAYRFSKDFSSLGIAYGLLYQSRFLKSAGRSGFSSGFLYVLNLYHETKNILILNIKKLSKKHRFQ